MYSHFYADYDVSRIRSSLLKARYWLFRKTAKNFRSHARPQSGKKARAVATASAADATAANAGRRKVVRKRLAATVHSRLSRCTVLQQG